MNSNNERMSTKESTEFVNKLFIITKNKSLVEAINILKSVLYILRLEKRLPNKFRMECCIEQYIELGKENYLKKDSWRYIYDIDPQVILKYGNFDEILGNEYIQKVYEYEEETKRKREEKRRQEEERRQEEIRKQEEVRKLEEERIQQEEKEQRRKLRGSRYGGYNDVTRGARLNQERAQIEEVTITENKTREDPDLDTKIFSSNWYAYIYYFFIIVMLICVIGGFIAVL